jgi:hypothetical protein
MKPSTDARRMAPSREGRYQEQGEVVLLDEFAETLHELPQELIGEDRAQALWDEDADGSASAHRQSARGRMRRVAEVERDLPHPVERGLTELLRVVEREGDGGLRHAGGAGHVSDGDPRHHMATRDTKVPSSYPTCKPL